MIDNIIYILKNIFLEYLKYIFYICFDIHIKNFINLNIFFNKFNNL